MYNVLNSLASIQRSAASKMYRKRVANDTRHKRTVKINKYEHLHDVNTCECETKTTKKNMPRTYLQLNR